MRRRLNSAPRAVMARGPVTAIAIVMMTVAGCTSSTASSETSRPGSTNAPVTTAPVMPPGSVVIDTRVPTTSVATTTTPVGSVTTVPEVPYPVPTHRDARGFDDHTVPHLATVEEWMGLSRSGAKGQRAVKFTIPNMAVPTMHWFDSNFYALHDEWFWFRLLNGQPIDGSKFPPVNGPRFRTVRDVYAWAAAQAPASLPLDLTFSDGRGAERRLYSSHFYELALKSPRRMLVGTVIRFDGDASHDARWMIEFEFSDAVTQATLTAAFAHIRASVPAEIGNSLGWLIRSPQQAGVAAALRKAGDPLGALAVRFEELVPPGTTEVYSQGITAGRLLYVGEGGAELARAADDDIIVMEHVPDYLPAARAILTSDLQTPLAHVSLLARNRRIPDVSISGIHENPGLRQAARVRSLAAVQATADGRVRIVLITREQYDAWNRARTTPPTSVVQADLSLVPDVIDLSALAEDTVTQGDIERWRSFIGGKSAGFLTLLSTPGLTPPPTPLAISIRPYREHLAPLRGSIEAVLRDSDFVASPRARWLLLEGAEEYEAMFPGGADARFRDEFVARRPVSTPVGAVLAAGGLRQMIRRRPIERSTLRVIEGGLQQTFGHYAASAGLRFRSSSTVEDIEGFNGAGLYTSYTGYFDPSVLADESERDKTIESAIAKTWASYWGFEAFEERRLEQIDHLSGAMGIVVHARFDDELERNNGVATHTFVPGGAPGDAVVEINVQHGSVDVTNPDNTAGQTPEVVRVRRIGSAPLAIERVSASSVAPTRQVLDDPAVIEVFTQLDGVARRWRDRLNGSLQPAQRVQSTVLDFEFKTVRAGWPKLVPGEPPYPARLVVRQVRSLDPGMRGVSEVVRSLAVPLDVLSRATLVRRFVCSNGESWVEVTTDPFSVPDMGYSGLPWGDRDESAFGTSCRAENLFASPDQLLAGIVADPGSFAVVDAGRS